MHHSQSSRKAIMVTSALLLLGIATLAQSRSDKFRSLNGTVRPSISALPQKSTGVSFHTNTVTSLSDSGPGSLRQAIADAAPEDAIVFATNGTIILTNGELVITNNLIITGSSATNLTISGNQASRVFNIASSNATVTISDLTIRDGKAPNGMDGYESVLGVPGEPGSDGGGIYNLGNLTLNHCVFIANAAGNGGHGGDGPYYGMFGNRYNGGDGGNAGNGGGIYNQNSLTLFSCVFIGNNGGAGGNGGSGDNGGKGGPGGAGGGVYNVCAMEMIACTFNANIGGNGGSGGNGGNGGSGGNGGFGGHGGGVFNANTISISGCSFNANQSGTGGSGGCSGCGIGGFGGDGGAGGDGGNGGGIYSTNALTMISCTVSGNRSGLGGLGGFGANGISRNGGFGGIGGNGGNGGGVYGATTLCLTTCTFNSNTSGAGGVGGNGGNAGANYPGGTGGPGGDGGAGGAGGGAYNTGILSLTACTISANAGGNGGYGGAGGNGSSPGVFGSVTNGGSGGFGGNGGGGGAIADGSGTASATLHNGLFAQNAAGSGGMGGPGGANETGDAFGQTGLTGIVGSGHDLSGIFTSLGHNLLGQSGGSTGLIDRLNGDLVGSAAAPINPFLGALTNNGGTTWTMALLPDSPAINAGDDSLTGTDQRGVARQSGAHVDIGAFELDVSSYLAPSTTLANCTVSNNAGNGLSFAIFNTTVNPNGMFSLVYLEYGVTTNYGVATTSVSVGNGTNVVATNFLLTALAPGLAYHYRVVATSSIGTSFGPDQTMTTTPPGDLNGDGIVDPSEFAAVLASYHPANPWLQITNQLGLGGTNVTFALPNDTISPFSVEFSTNLTDWQLLGPATPRYEFTDTNAPASSPRFYRLRLP
jgi:hypothetical protein